MSVTKAKRQPEGQQKHALIILGGSHNPRLRNMGPKPTIQLPDSRYLLQHQLDILKRLFIPSEIILTVGYEADRIIEKKFDVRIIENQRYQDTGEVEELRLALNAVSCDRALIISGDIFAKIGLIRELNPNTSWCVGVDATDDRTEIGFQDTEFIDGFSYTYDSKFIGMLNLGHEELFYLKKILTRDKAKIALWELVEELIKRDVKLKGIHSKELLKLNSLKDLQRLKTTIGIFN